MARQRFIVVFDVDPAEGSKGTGAAYDKFDISTWVEAACGDANRSVDVVTYDSVEDLLADHRDGEGAFAPGYGRESQA